MSEPFLTVADLARRLNAQPYTVRKWARLGLIPGACKPFGRAWRFETKAVEARLAEAVQLGAEVGA